MKNKELFEIDGYPVYENTIYTVNDKIDYSLPRGFIDAGVSKVPGTGDAANCPFHDASGIYNHGFDDASPRYYNQDKKLAKSTASNLRKNILKPYLEKNGYTEEEVSGRKGIDFWDDYVKSFDETTKFNTTNPDEAMGLYISILAGKLAPKGHENKYRYIGACYTVDNVEVKTQRHSESIIQKHRAIAHFGNMASNMDKLKAILLYSGQEAEYLADEGSAAIYFENNLQGKPEKLKEFNDNVEFYEENDENSTEVEVYRRLFLMNKAKDGKLVTTSKGIMYNGTELALDLRASAKRLANTDDKTMLDITKEIVLL